MVEWRIAAELSFLHLCTDLRWIHLEWFFEQCVYSKSELMLDFTKDALSLYIYV